ncbi:MAG: YceI family protein [Pseudomonadota bacterium]
MFTSSAACAQPVSYELVAKGSELRFVGEQQGAAFTGRFKTFSAEVAFDPAAPEAGRIASEVDVRSADSRSRDRDEYLQSRDFFYSRKFPTATFETVAIEADDDGGYRARANLTLRGETREVTMRFNFDPSSGARAKLTGSVLLNRLDFGVGQGEWRDTSEVADEVRVEIELVLKVLG